jgi:Fe2+ transport system protein B
MVPWAGLPVFLAVFFGMLALAWPIAVRLQEWLYPDSSLKTPVRSRVA